MGFVAPPEMARPLTVAALIGLASVAPTRLPADEPSLKDVVRRMSAYAETYGEKGSIVVATERYTQDVNGSRPPSMDHRVTVADFAIVKARGPYGEWVGFRDVVEVDGARITDREDRLIQLLTASAAWTKRGGSPTRARASTSVRSCVTSTCPPPPFSSSGRRISAGSSSRDRASAETAPGSSHLAKPSAPR